MRTGDGTQAHWAAWWLTYHFGVVGAGDRTDFRGDTRRSLLIAAEYRLSISTRSRTCSLAGKAGAGVTPWEAHAISLRWY
jgi:hypothetical protein